MTANKLCFLARSLERGGAERQLVTLAKGLVARGWEVSVWLFYGGGVFENELRASGVRVIDLKKGGRFDLLPFFIRFIGTLRREQPAVLHGYLTVANLVAITAKLFLPNVRVIWGIRASNMDLSRYDWLSRLSADCEARLSRFADLIIANSQAGRSHAIERGLPDPKVIVIPNGIDTRRFQFRAQARLELRATWGIGDHEILVGLVARLDPMKDHPNFLEAAHQLAAKNPDILFVCVGQGDRAYTELLVRRAESLGLSRRVIWVGARDDMPDVYSAFDIAISCSSFGEGFSNTIAEAMACGLPVVATDVGDSAWLVGDCGCVVPTCDPEALMHALLGLASFSPEQRRALGKRARERILTNFGVEALLAKTEEALALQ